MASYLIRKTFFGWTGKAKAALPNVVGMREADALAQIGRVQNPGTRTTAASTGVINKDRVISTNPAAGVANYPDTVAVAYVVSTGMNVTLTDTGDVVGITTGHGIVNNDPVYLASITTTTGAVINTQYYAKAVAATTLQLSLTPGGAAVALTTNGTGVLVRGYVGGPLA